MLIDKLELDYGARQTKEGQQFFSDVASNVFTEVIESGNAWTQTEGESEKKESKNRLSKLYYHMLIHFWDMLRYLAPQNAKDQEASWRRDRNDFHYQKKDHLMFVHIWKSALREIGKKNQHCNDSKFEDFKSGKDLPHSIIIPSWMIYPDIQISNFRVQFKYLLQILVDIPEKYVK